MLKLKCQKHTRYSGKESPRCSCDICYWIWKLRQLADLNRVPIVE